MVSRGHTLCVSSAALARANSCGSMPPGAVGITDVCGCVANGLGAAGCGPSGVNTVGNTLELAAEERIAPAAPMAPRRNISLRFNDIQYPPGEAMLLSFNGLMADNLIVQVARPIAVGARFTAEVTISQRVESIGGGC